MIVAFAVEGEVSTGAVAATADADTMAGREPTTVHGWTAGAVEGAVGGAVGTGRAVDTMVEGEGEGGIIPETAAPGPTETNTNSIGTTGRPPPH